MTTPEPPPVVPRRPFLLIAVLAALGLALAIGGGQLFYWGGSPYYLLAGLAAVATAVLASRRNRRSIQLYAAIVVATLAWALWESGLDGWALAPRVLPWTALGLWFLLPWTRAERKARHILAGSMALTLIVVALPFFENPVVKDGPLPPVAALAADPETAGEEWTAYGGGPLGQRFSTLSQISTANVSRLEPLWTYRTGETGKAMETTPIKVGDSLYLCTPHDIVISLDAATGRENWRFDPRVDASQAYTITCRGVAYARTAEGPGVCSERILVGTVDARLMALDARSGQPCRDFGNGGAVDLREGLGTVIPGFYYVTSPPVVVNGHAVIGAYVRDNQSTDEPSGVIRSFDPVTGALQWAWDAGAPERTGAPSPGATYTRGTPNAWTVFAADPELGLAYVPTGNAPPDFFGGRRRPVDDQWSSALVALDVATGRPRWSFQTTHHDLWDYDVPAQPVLVDLAIGGASVPAVVQATKSGEVFVLDRRTGRPLLPVTERRVPQGAVPGERLSPTQPFSALSLRPPDLTEASMWGVTPIDQMLCRLRFHQARYEGVYTPIGTDPTIVFPGSFGAVDWGSVAVDPSRGVMFANTSALPYYSRLVPRAQAPETARVIQPVSVGGKPGRADYRWSPQVGTPYVSHTVPFMGLFDIPCTQPPWGLLQAVDLRSGKRLWTRPIGTAQDSGPGGISSHLPVLMGVPNVGGSLVTAGGLVFNGATLDRYLRAYDQRSGRLLWQHRLPAGGQATPMTYATQSGRQVVVIAAGGHPGLKTKLGDAVLAFALKE